MTQDQLKQFRIRAAQQGYNASEIDNYLSSGNSFQERQQAYQSTLPQNYSQQSSNHPGFFKSALTSIFKPLTSFVASEARDIQSTPDVIRGVFGNKEAGQRAYQTQMRPVNLPFFGKTRTVKSMPTEEQAGLGLQTAANLIPGAGMGAGLAAKVGVGAATGYAFDVANKLQEGKSASETLTPGLGTVVGAGLPVAGAGYQLAKGIVGRLFKGLGSTLSGVSQKTIDQIMENPSAAQKAGQILKQKGNDWVLEKNAKDIINGYTKIQREASQKYAQGLDSLAKTDINPKLINDSLKKAAQDSKIGLTKGKLDFSQADFIEPKIQARASDLLRKISEIKDLSGKGIRKMMDVAESAKFKVASDGERQAFNAFADNIKTALRGAVNQSTNKLSEINKAYSADMQLSEVMQNIFGKVNYKSLPDVVKASQKLETLFSQKGLAPREVENFLQRIGIDPSAFKATEAIRQISGKEMPANSPGFSVGEILRSITSAVVDPEAVGWVATRTGLTNEAVQPFLQFLRKMSPYAQKAILQALLGTSETQQPPEMQLEQGKISQ